MLSLIQHVQQTANKPVFGKCTDLKRYRLWIFHIQNIPATYLVLLPARILQAPPLPELVLARSGPWDPCRPKCNGVCSLLAISSHRRQRVRLQINGFILGLHQSRAEKKPKQNQKTPTKSWIFQLKTWLDSYTQLSPRLLLVLFLRPSRMELIGTTDYLHEAEFAQRNTLLFTDWSCLKRLEESSQAKNYFFMPEHWTDLPCALLNAAWKTAASLDASWAFGDKHMEEMWHSCGLSPQSSAER